MFIFFINYENTHLFVEFFRPEGVLDKDFLQVNQFLGTSPQFLASTIIQELLNSRAQAAVFAGLSRDMEPVLSTRFSGACPVTMFIKVLILAKYMNIIMLHWFPHRRRYR